MFVKILIVVLVFIVGLLGFIATRPADFQVTRTRTVAAPPDVVYGYVNDLRKWREWSPGAAAGTGASYHWIGNKQVGEGRMTITESRPARSIALQLEFIKPWTATNRAQFDFAPSGSGTSVTWTMSGEKNFMAKAFGLLLDVDKLVGTDFDRGLENLDAVSGAAARKASRREGEGDAA
jgi:uncharacterized protein YndB with AHSA1/START domain